jgi:hypothetical protein
LEYVKQEYSDQNTTLVSTGLKSFAAGTVEYDQFIDLIRKIQKGSFVQGSVKAMNAERDIVEVLFQVRLQKSYTYCLIAHQDVEFREGDSEYPDMNSRKLKSWISVFLF